MYMHCTRRLTGTIVVIKATDIIDVLPIISGSGHSYHIVQTFDWLIRKSYYLHYGLAWHVDNDPLPIRPLPVAPAWESVTLI